MSEFGDISRMNLSELDRKGQMEDKEDDLELVAEDLEEDSAELAVQAGNEVAVTSLDEADGEAWAADARPEVEVSSGKEHMAAPNGKHYYIDAQITPKEMTAFMFAHNYRSPLMILATLVGLVWPVYTAIKAEGSMMVAVVCALVFLVVMPFSIWRRGTSNVTQNPIYQNTFHYMLDESGVHLELGDRAVDVEWNKVTRKLFIKSCVAIYTGKINAYLIPTEAMGSNKDEIISFIREH